MPEQVPEALLHEPVPIFLTIMAIILIAPLLSERVRLPGIIGLIIGGILVGPYGFNILAEGNIILLFATVGLIYLMFNAGLEIDLGQFNRVRNKAISFGVFTFLIPLVGGTLFGRALGYSWLGSILLGSALSSHTLLAFPVLTRLGVLSNETVSVTVGATVFTDVSAFLVLAIVTGVHGGEASVLQIVTLVATILIFGALVLFGLPRVGKFVFRHLRGHSIEFQFVLVALFVTAFSAELIGMHEVVGAFLAGLAINSTVSRYSPVINRVIFLGEALFIPAFLIYSGMITDPAAFVEGGNTLVVGIGLTAIAYIAKYIAAYITSRIFRYTRDETMTMWGLSQCQAAVTLPTVLVGVEAGLFPQEVFSGTMLMILATSITSPLIVQRYAKRLTLPSAVQRSDDPFKRILVSIANPDTQERLIQLASVLTRAQGGVLLPLNIALESHGVVSNLSAQRRLMQAESLHDADTHIQPIRRVDNSIARGIMHAAIEQDATLIMMGWRGKASFRGSIFGTTLDQVLWDATVPVIVARLTEPLNALREVIIMVTEGSTAFESIDEMAAAALLIADSINVPLTVYTSDRYFEEMHACLHRLKIEHAFKVYKLDGTPLSDLISKVEPTDLVMFSASGTRQRFQSSLGTIPEEFAAKSTASLIVLHYPSAR